MKFKNYDSNDLLGTYEISIKIDGVRCHKIDGNYVSRNGNKLYNIPEFDGEIAEIYLDTFKETIEAVKNHKYKYLPISAIYMLSPYLDERLIIGTYTNPTKDTIYSLLNKYVKLGFEGLILKQNDSYIKVKKQYSEDVLITGIVEGKGKYKGMLGAFKTEKGNVGTGFTEKERLLYMDTNLIGKYIEVDSMETTIKGKFRHPRFKRLRLDK